MAPGDAHKGARYATAAAASAQEERQLSKAQAGRTVYLPLCRTPHASARAMEPQRRAPPGFSGRSGPPAPEVGPPQVSGPPVNLGGFGLSSGPSPLMRMLNASQGEWRLRGRAAGLRRFSS